jgi:hypothetical protein
MLAITMRRRSQEIIVGHNNETMKLVNNVGHNTEKKKLVKNSHFEAMEAPQPHQQNLHQILLAPQ